MPGPTRIDQTPIRLNTKVAEDRQTPKTDFGSKLKDGLESTAGVAGTIASGLPGGSILSAAVSAGSSVVSGSSSGGGVSGIAGGSTSRLTLPSSTPTSTPTSTTGSTSSTTMVSNVGTTDPYAMGMSMIDAQAASNVQYISLQQRMQNENQKYTCISNVMKNRHDTAKNTIGNVH